MEEQGQLIEIGMAEMKIGSPPCVLITRGLGSCVGIVFYDSVKKLGALAHPMLPDIEKSKIRLNPAKFVNSVIEMMHKEFKNRGSLPYAIRAKLFGGGHMFSSIPKDSLFNIGAKNVAMAKEKLEALGIKVVGEDTGGNYGRTIRLDVDSGKVNVKTIFHGEKDI